MCLESSSCTICQVNTQREEWGELDFLNRNSENTFLDALTTYIHTLLSCWLLVLSLPFSILNVAPFADMAEFKSSGTVEHLPAILPHPFLLFTLEVA